MVSLLSSILVIVGVVALFRALGRNSYHTPKDRQNTYTRDDYAVQEEAQRSQAELLPLTGAYQKSWMFSYNEKDAYYKLSSIAKDLGYIVFAKVRLLDLLTPVRNNAKYKTYFYKVQAKHVDFVLCDQNLVARCIVELDDGSHDSIDRAERDSFVDAVLTSVGYKVIRVRAITDDIRYKIVK